MISGLIIGIVEDNVDPTKMHRVLVRYPVTSEDTLKSSWCRMVSPMAGAYRGLVMLPDIGTEVVLAFAYRSMSPYILGAVYNGSDDKPEPYHNDDTLNAKRVFWSRNNHMVIFDDTPGGEKVQFAAQAPIRLLAKTGVIHQTLDSSARRIQEYCDGNTIWEAGQTISLKCTDFKLSAAATIDIESGQATNMASEVSTTIESTGEQRLSAPSTKINPGQQPPPPSIALPVPPHYHPPKIVIGFTSDGSEATTEEDSEATTEEGTEATAEDVNETA